MKKDNCRLCGANKELVRHPDYGMICTSCYDRIEAADKKGIAINVTTLMNAGYGQKPRTYWRLSKDEPCVEWHDVPAEIKRGINNRSVAVLGEGYKERIKAFEAKVKRKKIVS